MKGPPELRAQARRANLDSVRALLSCGEFDYPVPARARVTDATAAKAEERAGTLRPNCCHTCRIESRQTR